jgi:hypothetical protein
MTFFQLYYVEIGGFVFKINLKVLQMNISVKDRKK